MTVSKPVLSRLVAGPFPALEKELLTRIAGTAGRDPARERILLVPSNELREYLLRRLAARWEGSAAGFSIRTLYDFALRLLKHRGLFVEELPPARHAAALSAAVRETYAKGSGDFAGISATKGFLPALSRTLADLEEGWIDDESLRRAQRAASAAGRPDGAARWAEWRRLAAAAERKVRALGGMTRRRIFQEAVSGFEQPGYPFRVTLYGFYDFTRLQWTLVDALLSSGLLEEVYFPGLFTAEGALSPAFAYAAGTWERTRRAFEGNVTFLPGEAAPAIRATREALFSPDPPPSAPVPVPFSLLSAPHEEGELRLAARTIRGWLDEDPDREILLLARRFPEEAVPLWERTAAEYGIRAASRTGVPLASVPPVQLLLRMLEAAGRDFPRRTVIEILSSPYRRPEQEGDGPEPRPDLWDLWSRERMVVGGADWESRMSVARRGGHDEEEEGERGDEEAQQRRLLSEVRALRTALRPVMEAKGYAAFSEAIRDLLLGNRPLEEDGTAEAERDRRALDDLLDLLDDIGRIPPGEVPWPPPEGALPWFSGLLSERRLFLGERGGMRVPGAVVAGDLESLRGATADRILLLSVNEENVPAQLEEDPLLPDEEREELNRLLRRPDLPDPLPLRRKNASEEKLLFSLPAASCREEIAFSLLRSDAAGNEQRPSRYLLLLLSRFAGPGVFSGDLEREAGVSVRRLPRPPLLALSDPPPQSRRERALAGWLAGSPPADGGEGIPWHRIVPAIAALARRREGIGLFPAAWTRLPPHVAFSASSLDDLAACPYRFFLRRMAGILPVEEPEESIALTPAEEGRILHDILRRLGEEAARDGAWPDPAEASRRSVSRFARENPTGLPGLYRIRCREIEAAAAALVARERSGGSGASVVRGVEEPFSLPGTEEHPPLRGRVDRIDRDPSGALEVIDYKYRDGAKERLPLERIRAGLSHQVPVYLEFARSRSDAARVTLLFLRRGVHAVSLESSRWTDLRGEWVEALRAWLALPAAGFFPPLPHHRFTFAGKIPPRYCDPCPYRDHCRVSPAFSGTGRETDGLADRLDGAAGFRRVSAFRPRKER